MAHRAERTISALVAVATGAVVTGLTAELVCAAEWEFTPRVHAGLTWTDNVTAAGEADEQSEWISSLAPGLRLGLEGTRADLSLDYEAQALWYRNNSDFDDVYHSLLGNGAFMLVPDHLYLDVFARYDQENIDPGGRVTSGNLFRTGNRTDAAVYGISPWYQARVGQWGVASVRYRFQGVNYTNTDATSLRVRDSDTHSIFAQLQSPQDRPGLNWGARVSHSRTEFDGGPEFKYGQAAANLGYPVGVRTRATATVGLESDVAADPTEGGFDESFWYLGVAWEPSALQTLEARVGNRYYGSAYEFRWDRRGTRGDLAVEYSETPTTANQRLFDGEGVFSGGRPGAPGLDRRVFLSKRLTGRMSYDLVRTRLGASVYADKRERQGDDPQAERDDEVWGLRLTTDWDAAMRSRVNLSIRYEDRKARGAERSSDLLDFSASLRRDLTRNVFAQIRAHHVRRNLETRDDYRINAATLTVGAEF